MQFKNNHLKFIDIILAAFVCATVGQVQAQQSVDQSINNGVIPSSGGEGGNYSYQADLFTGRFTYSVPIKVAPARQGAEPKLTISYNSSGGSSWCGVGWGLDMGYIQRDVRYGVPILWANTSSNVLVSQNAYDDSKGFIACVGGANSTLVKVSTAGQNPAVYRQESDNTFNIYNYYTNNNYWVIIDKSGNQYFFGEGATNQMENTKTNWTKGVGSSTFRWALDRVVDPNGNETFMQYSTDYSSLYLTNIAYNANLNSPSLAATHVISFILTNRPDTNISFISGYRVQLQKRLSEIRVYAGGQNVRKYVLGYSQSPSTLRSLLSSVTEYGSDFTTSLPPIAFNYQVESFSFGPQTNWNGVYNDNTHNGSAWGAIRSFDGGNATAVMPVDLDGDGLVDRVRENYNSYGGNVPPYTNNFYAMRNANGSFFDYSGTNYQIGNINDQGDTNENWNAPNGLLAANGITTCDLLDMNGDGYPDRVMSTDGNFIGGTITNIWVQLNSGYINSTNQFGPMVHWTNVTDYESTMGMWRAMRYIHDVDLLDMNGDGLPDRVSGKVNNPYNVFKVQLNTGGGFQNDALWTGVDTQGVSGNNWGEPSNVDGSGNYCIIMMDINGDGLPDRVTRLPNGNCTNFVVQYNNGAGFEPVEQWGPVDNQGNGSDSNWGSPIGTDGANVRTTLVDINGDGLPDHVMRMENYPYTNWLVQINTGNGFAPSTTWQNIQCQGQTNNADWNGISARNNGDTYVDFYDINGDGLPDRVMRSNSGTYTNLVVQLNQGPYPDLMCCVSNGLGGSATVSYIASTTLNNHDKDYVSDPWAEGARSLLPFNQWVVSQIVANDGMGNLSTNSYAFKGGYFNTAKREFRGFSQATITDPMGTKTTTYFHQSGGRDNSAIGEYMDQGSVSKKGFPFRVEVVGNDGKTNTISLTKVVENVLNTNGWYFPYVAQTIVMTYEGLPNYRAIAKQYTYDTNTGNLLMTANLGEVTNIVINGQSFSDVGTDSVYTFITYTNIGNIVDRQIDVKNTSDSLGANRLREATVSYDSCGRSLVSQVWSSSSNAFITAGQYSYDQYGNKITSTDAAGIVSANQFDSIYEQYPISSITGTFTNTSLSDIRSGMTVSATDPNGLIESNSYDVFYRLTATYISTNVGGQPTLWKTKTTYSNGGISNGVSLNYVYQQENDAVDPVNGFQTFEYSDGLGRSIETRMEAENGQFRVANMTYNLRGQPYFQTFPYFNSGTSYTIPNSTYLGVLTEFDPIGRTFRATPSVQGNFNSSGQLLSTNLTGGDSGSSVGATTTYFVDGSNPWATIVVDANGKSKKASRDAYGRTVAITEVTTNGNYNTTYSYDLLGNPTNVTDSAGNSTSMVYDSLGRKTSMTDPDM